MMTTAIHIIALGMEYAGDLLLCIGGVTFLALVACDHGIA